MQGSASPFRLAMPSRVARIVADEAPRVKVLPRLLDLRAGVHHERSVTGDRLAERPSRREEKSASVGPRGRLDHVPVSA